MSRFLVPLLLLGLVALLGYALITPSKTPSSALMGQPAPAFSLQDLDGQTHTLNVDERQPEPPKPPEPKPIVLNFWASWCTPCHDEAPIFAQILQEMPDKVQFLGVLYNDAAKNAPPFMQQYGLSYPTLIDPSSRVAMSYGVGKIPVTYIINTAGVVTYEQQGPVLDIAAFRAALQAASQTVEADTP